MKKTVLLGICILLMSHAEENPFDLDKNFQKIDKEQAALLSTLKTMHKHTIKRHIQRGSATQKRVVLPSRVYRKPVERPAVNNSSPTPHSMPIQKVAPKTIVKKEVKPNTPLKDKNITVQKKKIDSSVNALQETKENVKNKNSVPKQKTLAEKKAEEEAKKKKEQRIKEKLAKEKIEKEKTAKEKREQAIKEKQAKIARAKKIREERAEAMRIKKLAEKKREAQRIAKEKALKAKKEKLAKEQALKKKEEEKQAAIKKRKLEQVQKEAAKKLHQETLLKKEKITKEKLLHKKEVVSKANDTTVHIDLTKEALMKKKAIEEAYREAIKDVDR